MVAMASEIKTIKTEIQNYGISELDEDIETAKRLGILNESNK
jgi:hypothetical protein